MLGESFLQGVHALKNMSKPVSMYLWLPVTYIVNCKQRQPGWGWEQS